MGSIPSSLPDFTEPPAAPQLVSPREPPWTGWDVIKIAVLLFMVPIVVDFLVAFGAHKLLYRQTPWLDLAQKPLVELVSEIIAYLVVLLYMVALVEGQYHREFATAISWRWPRRLWGLATLGVGLLFGLQILARFLPIPKEVPFDQFFRHPLDAYLTSILAISIGPIMEELFFRGFLYPVLARRVGMVISILLTAAAFGLLHAMQLGFAWSAVFIIFLVGVVLTTVRALTNSVGSSVVVHIAYNLTLTALTFASTSGFRHLDLLDRSAK